MKCKKIRYLGVTLVIVLIVLGAISYCPHKVTYTDVVKEATCFEEGQIDTICEKCDTVLVSNTLEKNAHTFGEYELTIKPNALRPGVEVRVCSTCSKNEQREFYCSHEVSYTKIIKEATCFEEGQIDSICEMCDMVLAKNTLEKTAHTFGEYKVITNPSASKLGLEIRVCSICSEEEKREYYSCGTELMETLEKNSIYIAGTDINHAFTISSFTQSAVDSYDIVYTECSKSGSNNPFILGHNYRPLGRLYQTKVGEYVYLNINGVIEIYEVVVSEYGVLNSTNDDIIGQTTGTSIWHSYDCKTLHMYTCYGNNGIGRWIVLAKKIS